MLLRPISDLEQLLVRKGCGLSWFSFYLKSLVFHDEVVLLPSLLLLLLLLVLLDDAGGPVTRVSNAP